jgi:flagellar motor switch protein FliG
MEQALPEGLRKAALLLAGLDRASADAMLRALAPDQARCLRQAVVRLDEIDPVEQQEVIEEFLRADPRRPRQQPSGVELDEGLARRLGLSSAGQPAVRDDETRGEPQRTPTPPFGFLHDAETEKLAGLLSAERPQTIAVVLSHLPAERAAGVLGRLPAPVQADVLRRLADLEETEPSILRELEGALQARFSRQVGIRPKRVAGVGAIGDILEAADGRLAVQILENLAAHDRGLAERLGPPPVQFGDLALLDEAGLRLLFAHVESEVLCTALIGAPPRLAGRMLGALPPDEAAEIRRQMDAPGPIKLSDLEEARRRIAERAWCLAAQGRLRLPARHALTAA